MACKYHSSTIICSVYNIDLAPNCQCLQVLPPDAETKGARHTSTALPANHHHHVRPDHGD
jgi:hypothetical protein